MVMWEEAETEGGVGGVVCVVGKRVGLGGGWKEIVMSSGGVLEFGGVGWVGGWGGWGGWGWLGGWMGWVSRFGGTEWGRRVMTSFQ